MAWPSVSKGELQLQFQLLKLAEESGLSFQEVCRALTRAQQTLQKKGENLLNAANIQEVAKENGDINQ